MPRRGENIYKRKDGRWEARILKQNGKYQYVYAKSYKSVKEKKKNCKEYLSTCRAKKTDGVKSAAGLFEFWLNGIFDQVKPSTYENYDCCIHKYVIPFYQETGQAQITDRSVSQFVKSISDNSILSETYKRKILVIFKTALREILRGSTESAPILAAVRIPRARSSVVQVFSKNEQRLVENAALHSEDERALGIVLCFYTGIRLGELCALKWGDIDLETGNMSITKTVSRLKNYQGGDQKTILAVRTPKSQKSARKIPLPDFLLNLSGRLKGDDECYVLTGCKTAIDPRTYQKLYKKIIKAAGVRDHKFHAIRHTFATRALELGVDIKTLSEILGHSSVTITLNIYAHSLMEQKKIAIEKMNLMHITQMESPSFAVASPVNSI